MRSATWSIKDIIKVLVDRQKNEFDGNIAVSGDRGNGKSTSIGKIFYRFPVFKPWKHQVYNREEIIHLLKTQMYGLCWDDEAINSGYKRDFQQTGQKELIKILTNYRDNFNIFASAIPNFFSLDKDLRDLYFLHLHIIERGIAVVHMPLQGRLYSQDRWDVKFNAKIEERWSKRIKKNPNFKPPYHKLSTFRGYLFFGDLSKRQKVLYLKVKKTKRTGELEDNGDSSNISWIQELYNFLLTGRLTNETLLGMCLAKGKKYLGVRAALNGMLKDNGETRTLADLIMKTVNKDNHSSSMEEINKLVPDI